MSAFTAVGEATAISLSTCHCTAETPFEKSMKRDVPLQRKRPARATSQFYNEDILRYVAAAISGAIAYCPCRTALLSYFVIRLNEVSRAVQEGPNNEKNLPGPRPYPSTGSRWSRGTHAFPAENSQILLLISRARQSRQAGVESINEAMRLLLRTPKLNSRTPCTQIHLFISGSEVRIAGAWARHHRRCCSQIATAGLRGEALSGGSREGICIVSTSLSHAQSIGAAVGLGEVTGVRQQLASGTRETP